jgi:hypothetical protein
MTKQIDSIMENFNFENVHKVMEFLNWEWQDMGIPSISQLKLEAERLLLLAVSKKHKIIGTGGFEVLRRKNGNISLYFVVEESDGLA